MWKKENKGKKGRKQRRKGGRKGGRERKKGRKSLIILGLGEVAHTVNNFRHSLALLLKFWSSSITWEFVQRAYSQAPSQTYCICILTRSTEDTEAGQELLSAQAGKRCSQEVRQASLLKGNTSEMVENFRWKLVQRDNEHVWPCDNDLR